MFEEKRKMKKEKKVVQVYMDNELYEEINKLKDTLTKQASISYFCRQLLVKGLDSIKKK